MICLVIDLTDECRGQMQVVEDSGVFFVWDQYAAGLYYVCDNDNVDGRIIILGRPVSRDSRIITETRKSRVFFAKMPYFYVFKRIFCFNQHKLHFIVLLLFYFILFYCIAFYYKYFRYL